MVDHYAILGISPEASPEEIKKSFKRLAVRFHPDKNPRRREWSERKFREILDSYQVLADPRRRADYDNRYKWRGNGQEGDMRPYFFRRTDPRSLARRVLHYLMNCRSEEAIDLFLQMRTRYGPDVLWDYLEREECLDCEFLLAEAFETRGELHDAAENYRKVYLRERGAVRRRPYYDEVISRLKSLCLHKIARSLNPRDAFRYYRWAEDLDLTQRERAQVAKRRAEAYYATGDFPSAAQALREAMRLDPQLKGGGRLAEKLGRRMGTLRAGGAGKGRS